MTTATFNTFGFRPLPAFKSPSFFERRAALPDLASDSTLLPYALTVAAHVAMAAIPFAAIVWMFVTR